MISRSLPEIIPERTARCKAWESLGINSQRKLIILVWVHVYSIDGSVVYIYICIYVSVYIYTQYAQGSWLLALLPPVYLFLLFFTSIFLHPLPFPVYNLGPITCLSFFLTDYNVSLWRLVDDILGRFQDQRWWATQKQINIQEGQREKGNKQRYRQYGQRGKSEAERLIGPKPTA